MGEVYRGIDRLLNREVAIKVLNRSGIEHIEMRERFDRELRSVASLSSPQIVTLFDYATHDETRFAVMELAKGKTLREHLCGELNLQSVVNIVRGIATGLVAAHGSGIMHRDIKPENVIVGTNDEVKILDFGLARLGGSLQEPLVVP